MEEIMVTLLRSVLTTGVIGPERLASVQKLSLVTQEQEGAIPPANVPTTGVTGPGQLANVLLRQEDPNQPQNRHRACTEQPQLFAIFFNH